MMTLNDNPRVDAEKRLLQLISRRSLIMYLTSHEIVYDKKSGVAQKMYLNPDIGRGRRLINCINKEIREKEKFLKHFK